LADSSAGLLRNELCPSARPRRAEGSFFDAGLKCGKTGKSAFFSIRDVACHNGKLDFHSEIVR
jgi:hypothetical protein